MAGISKGLDYLRRQSQQQEKAPTIYKLWVSSGDSAKFWFLGNGSDDDLLAPMIHSLELTNKDGKPWTADVLCERSDRFEDISKCKYCREGVQGPWHRLVTWVWVDQIVHETQKKPEWTLAARGKGKVYVETPDPRVRLYIMKSRMAQQVMRRYEENGTLLDRPFRLEKTGSRQNVVETLTCPEEPMEVPKEVQEAIKNMQNLEQAVIQEFTRYAPKEAMSLAGAGRLVPSTNAELADEDEIVDFN